MKAFRNPGVILTLVLMSLPSAAGAAPDAIPSEFHGMWAAGTCAEPKYYLKIEGSGIRGYRPDKRSPIGNWDVEKTERRENTLIIDAPDTNTGTPFHFEIYSPTPTTLRIKLNSDTKSETNDYEACSSAPQ